MTKKNDIHSFLSQFNEQHSLNALRIREIILKNLPEVQEQIDVPARMIAYCYGQKYAEMVCTLIPSQNGVKIGFYKGVELPDPENILKGKGKLSRYVEIRSEADLNLKAFISLLNEAFNAYKARNNK